MNLQRFEFLPTHGDILQTLDSEDLQPKFQKLGIPGRPR